MSYGANHDKLANSEQSQAQSSAAVQAVREEPLSGTRVATQASCVPETATDLAERCEHATGADRNLDAMIHARNGLEGIGYASDSPAYTTSFDAALTLAVGNVGRLIREALQRAEEEYCNPGIEVLPRFLCAAALRAQAASVDTHPKGAARCTCAEVDGEDPQCAVHGLSLAGVAAWTDDECLMEGELDSFTVRRLVRRAVNALKPFADAFDGWEGEPEHHDAHTLWEHPLAMDLTLGDCQRAASAIEARRAATPKSGAVEDESAVAATGGETPVGGSNDRR